jgi:hypothetical protein
MHKGFVSKLILNIIVGNPTKFDIEDMPEIQHLLALRKD